MRCIYREGTPVGGVEYVLDIGHKQYLFTTCLLNTCTTHYALQKTNLKVSAHYLPHCLTLTRLLL